MSDISTSEASTHSPREGRWQFTSGIGCIAAAAFLFSLTAVFVKMTHLPTFEVVLFPSILCWLLTGSLMLITTGVTSTPSLPMLALVAMRSLLGCGALVCYYMAIEILPLSDAVTIFFTNPVMVVLLEWLLRMAKVRIAAVLGCVLTLLGVVLISRPSIIFGPGTQHHRQLMAETLSGAASGIGMPLPAAVLSAAESGMGGMVMAMAVAVAGAACNATSFVCMRLVGKRVSALSVTLCYHTVVGAASAAFLLAGYPQAPNWRAALHAWPLLLGVALTQFAGQLLINRGFQLETATRGAAVNVTQVLYSYLWSTLIFKQPASVLGTLGSALIVLGVLVVSSQDAIGSALSRSPSMAAFVQSLSRSPNRKRRRTDDNGLTEPLMPDGPEPPQGQANGTAEPAPVGAQLPAGPAAAGGLDPEAPAVREASSEQPPDSKLPAAASGDRSLPAGEVAKTIESAAGGTAKIAPAIHDTQEHASEVTVDAGVAARHDDAEQASEVTADAGVAASHDTVEQVAAMIEDAGAANAPASAKAASDMPQTESAAVGHATAATPGGSSPATTLLARRASFVLPALDVGGEDVSCEAAATACSRILSFGEQEMVCACGTQEMVCSWGGSQGEEGLLEPAAFRTCSSLVNWACCAPHVVATQEDTVPLSPRRVPDDVDAEEHPRYNRCRSHTEWSITRFAVDSEEPQFRFQPPPLPYEPRTPRPRTPTSPQPRLPLPPLDGTRPSTPGFTMVRKTSTLDLPTLLGWRGGDAAPGADAPDGLQSTEEERATGWKVFTQDIVGAGSGGLVTGAAGEMTLVSADMQPAIQDGESDAASSELGLDTGVCAEGAEDEALGTAAELVEPGAAESQGAVGQETPHMDNSAIEQGGGTQEMRSADAPESDEQAQDMREVANSVEHGAVALEMRDTDAADSAEEGAAAPDMPEAPNSSMDSTAELCGPATPFLAAPSTPDLPVSPVSSVRFRAWSSKRINANSADMPDTPPAVTVAASVMPASAPGAAAGTDDLPPAGEVGDLGWPQAAGDGVRPVTPVMPGTASRPRTPGGTSRPLTPGTVSRPQTPGGMSRPLTPGTASRPQTPGGAEDVDGRPQRAFSRRYCNWQVKRLFAAPTELQDGSLEADGSPASPRPVPPENENGMVCRLSFDALHGIPLSALGLPEEPPAAEPPPARVVPRHLTSSWKVVTKSLDASSDLRSSYSGDGDDDEGLVHTMSFPAAKFLVAARLQDVSDTVQGSDQPDAQHAQHGPSPPIPVPAPHHRVAGPYQPWKMSVIAPDGRLVTSLSTEAAAPGARPMSAPAKVLLDEPASDLGSRQASIKLFVRPCVSSSGSEEDGSGSGSPMLPVLPSLALQAALDGPDGNAAAQPGLVYA